MGQNGEKKRLPRLLGPPRDLVGRERGRRHQLTDARPQRRIARPAPGQEQALDVLSGSQRRDSFGHAAGHKFGQGGQAVIQVPGSMPLEIGLDEGPTVVLPPRAARKWTLQKGVLREESLDRIVIHRAPSRPDAVPVAFLGPVRAHDGERVEGQVRRPQVPGPAAPPVSVHQRRVRDASEIHDTGSGDPMELHPVEIGTEWCTLAARRDVAGSKVADDGNPRALGEQVQVPHLNREVLVGQMEHRLAMRPDHRDLRLVTAGQAEKLQRRLGEGIRDLAPESRSLHEREVRSAPQRRAQLGGMSATQMALVPDRQLATRAGEADEDRIGAIGRGSAVEPNDEPLLHGLLHKVTGAPRSSPARRLTCIPMATDTDRSRQPEILIVDDQDGIRKSIRQTLEYEDFVVHDAPAADRAMTQLESHPQIAAVLLDVKMPGEDGLTLLPRILAERPELPVIMISGHGTIETALEATRRGAFYFLEKPIDRDRLLLTLRNAVSRGRLSRENAALRRQVDHEWRIVGSSPGMLALKQTIERVAPSTARVLITGENGTGKELVARNLHLLSERREEPWVDVNCAAIPAELIESELFGHEKGAFTGADRQRSGRFEQAHRGTLFLDEIGDMPLAAQAKVLRVLQEEKVQRVGGEGEIPVDVRVLAATNKDLAEEVAEGRFREDLFYRLNVIPIAVPALRERGSDVSELFRNFLVETCRRYGRETMVFGEDVAHRLETQAWPGNVRELRNLAERVALLHTATELTEAALEGLGAQVREAAGPVGSLFDIDHFDAFRDAAEKLYLEQKLADNGWNVKRTAERLGMQRSNLYKKMDRHALKKPDPQSE